MGKLIVTEQVTLDGVAQAPGGPDDDRDGGFPHGGWQAPLMDQEADNIFEQAKSMDALLLGRRTYELFAGYWPTAPEEIPFTSLLNAVPKYVASRTLAGPLDWQGSTVVGEPIAESVTSLKERSQSGSSAKDCPRVSAEEFEKPVFLRHQGLQPAHPQRPSGF